MEKWKRKEVRAWDPETMPYPVGTETTVDETTVALRKPQGEAPAGSQMGEGVGA